MLSLENSLNYSWKDPALLELALTHKSFHYEQLSTSKGHNEKLEFIGDAVIGLVLSELLYIHFPEDEEGGLSKKRASLVNEEVLAKIAVELDLSEALRLGRGEQKSEGHKKPRLLASTYESVIGAIYLDGGYEKAKAIVVSHFEHFIEGLDPDHDYAQDYKTRVQEQVQQLYKITPHYELIDQTGPSHDPVFTVAIFFGEKKVAIGVGTSKKQAEQKAAKEALERGLDDFKL